MVYVKSNSSTTAWGRLTYIFDEPAHDGSQHRVLSVTGNNVRLWGSSKPYSSQSGYYLNQQFKAVRQRGWNKNKRQQAQHMILSFAESEFATDDPDELTKEADQVNKLIQGFMSQYFSGSQWVSAVQCDGNGHKLHSHVLINTIRINGKCVRTNKFNVDQLRQEWNQYLNGHYMTVTGHVYLNPYQKGEPGTQIKPKGWQADLKKTLDWARETAESIKEYLGFLKVKGVTVTERNKRGEWSYQTSINGKAKKVRDFYQRIDCKTGLVKSTRGMGRDYTPGALSEHFKAKAKKESDNNDKEDKRSGELERLASRDQQRRKRQLIDQFTFKRFDNEQRDESSDQAGSAKHGAGSDVQADSSGSSDGLEF